MTVAKIDIEANERRKREAARKIPFLVEFGNEEDIIAFTKRWNPGITSEQLNKVVKLFHAAQLARAHPSQSR
jgi:hypothetical protein